MGLMRTLLLKASESSWLADRASRRGFTQRAVRRFMPGEDVDAALAAAEQLGERNIPTLITQLGEAITNRAEADAVAQHYVDALQRIERRGLETQLSVKLTQLGLDISRDLCTEQLIAVLKQAAAHGNFVCIDMESSSYVDATLEIFRSVRAEHSNLGVCLQAYLYRTAEDLESLVPLSATIRLVKGAYNEPPRIAFPKKADVDANYFKLAKRLLAEDARPEGVYPAFGTHDLGLVTRIRDFAEGAGIAKSAYEIQMLYGIRREEQLRLAADGNVMRTLISYGDAWFPWYMRRLAERPANLWFVARSVVG
jgi:proline dehydrogenase